MSKPITTWTETNAALATHKPLGSLLAKPDQPREVDAAQLVTKIREFHEAAGRYPTLHSNPIDGTTTTWAAINQQFNKIGSSLARFIATGGAS
jgi:hypothetical protein